jgi:SanA protein
MSDYLQEQGVSAADIFQDYAGFDTYDSVYRAREIFQVQKAIIITQKFHLPRAIAIANDL